MLSKTRRLTKTIASSLLGLGLVLTAHTPLNALSFYFDYTYDTNNFFNTQAKKDLLTTAASYFTPITDNLTAICSPNCGGSNFWTASFSNPSTGATQQVSNLLVPTDTLIIYVGGRDLGGSILGEGGYGGFAASGTQAFLDSIIKRGQTGVGTTDFAPWGGSLAFDIDSTWNFTLDSPSAGQNDFLSVAIHELAHVLGIGTADSWDYFVSGGVFTGATSASVYGGNVPVTSGHWAEGITSTLPGINISQEAAMDPTITVGTNKLFTRLDYAGLDDIGWDVPANLTSADAVPFEFSPIPGIVILVGIFGISYWRKSSDGAQ